MRRTKKTQKETDRLIVALILRQGDSLTNPPLMIRRIEMDDGWVSKKSNSLSDLFSCLSLSLSLSLSLQPFKSGPGMRSLSCSFWWEPICQSAIGRSREKTKLIMQQPWMNRIADPLHWKLEIDIFEPGNLFWSVFTDWLSQLTPDLVFVNCFEKIGRDIRWHEMKRICLNQVNAICIVESSLLSNCQP